MDEHVVLKFHTIPALVEMSSSWFMVETRITGDIVRLLYFSLYMDMFFVLF